MAIVRPMQPQSLPPTIGSSPIQIHTDDMRFDYPAMNYWSIIAPLQHGKNWHTIGHTWSYR